MDFDAGPAVQALQAMYDSDLGLFHWDGSDNSMVDILDGSIMPGIKKRYQDTDRWWCTANAIGALIDYMSNTGDRTLLSSVVENTFDVAPTTFGLDFQHPLVPHADAHIDAGHIDANVPFHVDTNLPHGDSPHLDTPIPNKLPYTNFLNNFHDDDGWWALTWIKAYDLTRDPKYLNMAVTIFGDMAVGEGGWEDTFAGGGIYWARNKEGPDGNPPAPYKNAIANELLMAVAARLHLRKAGGATRVPRHQ